MNDSIDTPIRGILVDSDLLEWSRNQFTPNRSPSQSTAASAFSVPR